MYTVMYIPAPLYSIIVIGHVVYSTYCPPEFPAAVERVSPLSVGERTSPAPVPRRRCCRSRKPEVVNRNSASQ
ncbi:unnamed protein product [Staurois parvus]|uniref:Secreted protein n=1 Tax=Staurois parvus TaxID=386267 RepID=A0ABN9H4U3_9NEOB|nr:unnamed protein product [Staurois parvus]